MSQARPLTSCKCTQALQQASWRLRQLVRGASPACWQAVATAALPAGHPALTVEPEAIPSTLARLAAAHARIVHGAITSTAVSPARSLVLQPDMQRAFAWLEGGLQERSLWQPGQPVTWRQTAGPQQNVSSLACSRDSNLVAARGGLNKLLLLQRPCSPSPLETWVELAGAADATATYCTATGLVVTTGHAMRDVHDIVSRCHIYQASGQLLAESADYSWGLDVSESVWNLDKGFLPSPDGSLLASIFASHLVVLSSTAGAEVSSSSVQHIQAEISADTATVPGLLWSPCSQLVCVYSVCRRRRNRLHMFRARSGASEPIPNLGLGCVYSVARGLPGLACFHGNQALLLRWGGPQDTSRVLLLQTNFARNPVTSLPRSALAFTRDAAFIAVVTQPFGVDVLSSRTGHTVCSWTAPHGHAPLPQFCAQLEWGANGTCLRVSALSSNGSDSDKDETYVLSWS